MSGCSNNFKIQEQKTKRLVLGKYKDDSACYLILPNETKEIDVEIPCENWNQIKTDEYVYFEVIKGRFHLVDKETYDAD